MALDSNLRTVDELREEVSLLQQKIATAECDNGKLAADLLEWRKWYESGYKEEMMFLGSEIDRLAKLGENMVDDNDGVPKFPPSLRNRSKPRERRGPIVTVPPLPTRNMVLSASEPNLSSKALTNSGTQHALMATSPPRQPVKDPAPPAYTGETWERFLRRQTTQSYDLYMKHNVKFKEEVAEKRRTIVEVRYNRVGLANIHTQKDGVYVKDIQEGTALRRILKHRYKSIARGWHIGLDPDGKGRMGFYEFTQALHRFGYAGNLKELWADLVPQPPDGDGLISLEELDPPLAREVRNFKKTCVEKHGSILKAWMRNIDPEERGCLNVDEFDAGLKRLGFECKSAQRLLEWFDAHNRGVIGIGDIDAESALAKNQGLDHCTAEPVSSPKRNRRHMKFGEAKLTVHEEVHRDVREALSRTTASGRASFNLSGRSSGGLSGRPSAKE